jgi:mono/diheme cytochrome c family protein
MSGDESSDKHFPPTGKSRETFEGNRFEDDALQRVHAQLMREKEEPSENFSYPPLLLVFLFMLLFFWGGLYLAEYRGDFSPFVYDEHASLGGGASAPVAKDPLKVGKAVYVRNCLACHQADGMGMTGVYPPLVNSDWVKDKPERLIKLVLSGLQGEVVVNGTTYNNAMTPFGASLDDEKLASVLTYLRTAPEFGNESFAVEQDLVAQVRSEYGSRGEAWTQAELEAIHGPVTGDWAPADGGEAAAEETESTDTES